jgi:murein DD-endopeptidase MepM/ murein hydrolase activator NlpD
VKKNRFTEFFKGKGYYVLLFVGVLAIAAVAIIGSQLSANQNLEEQDYVDLNETEDNITADNGDTQLTENNPVSEGIVNNTNNSTGDIAANDNTGQDAVNNQDQVEYEGYADETTTGQDQAAGQTPATQSEDVAQTEEEESAVETTGTTVENAVDNLSFKTDDGLLWPVSGNVILNYSMDHTIYFATLMQYKCNPAIIIDAEVGTEVKAATDGVITKIEEYNEETGYTITMEIGDGYSLVYGQLDNVSLEVGDTVSEGDVIGTIAEPTKYYTVEGSNLYFQVLENDQTVNPMLLLR